MKKKITHDTYMIMQAILMSRDQVLFKNTAKAMVDELLVVNHTEVSSWDCEDSVKVVIGNEPLEVFTRSDS